MEEKALQELITALGPGGAVLMFIGWQFIKEIRNGKKASEDPNTAILHEIRDVLVEANGKANATQKRVEDIWEEVKKD